MTITQKMKNLLIERPIEIEKNLQDHRKILYRAFLGAMIYSIFYGIYEYSIVYHTIALVPNGIIPEYVNWAIMISGIIILIAILTRFSIQHIIFSLLFMAILEDFTFWMVQWINTGIYPFPVGAWWDDWYASFKVFGGIAWPLPFWPYLPYFYLPAIIMITSYYILCYIGPKGSRIYAWVVGPFWVAILMGCAIRDDVTLAFWILILIPLCSYSYVLTLLFIKKLKNSKRN